MIARGPLSLLAPVTLAMALWAGAAPAVKVDGLYQGQVPVAGKDEEGRAVALGEALRQVVGKLTGIASPSGPLVDAAVAEPQRYLQQFQYRDTPRADLPFALWARFDREAVDGILHDAGLPRWSAERPGILAWVVQVSEAGAEFVGADDLSGLAAALNRRAWERGLPLSFPLLDLEDRVRAHPADLWSLDETTVLAMSERYGAPAVLVGRLEATSAGAWVASWRLLDGGAGLEWVTRGLTARAAAAGAMDAVADRLAARYAVAGQDAAAGAIRIRVSGIRTLRDYARTLGYLQALDQVSELRLSAARGDELSFSLQVRGGAEGLRRVATFGGVLAADPQLQDGETLSFRLLP